MLEWITNIDTKLFLLLNGMHSPFWDKLMFWISGDKSWMPLYIVIIAWIVYKYKIKAIVVLLSIALLITLSDQLSVQLFKETVKRLRPCHNEQIASLVHIVNDKCGGMYGFVSSHAANTFALAGFLSILFVNRYFRIFIFAWAALVSYSRVYLGVHYPLDILCGAGLGLLVSLMVYRLYTFVLPRVLNKKRPK